MLNLQRIGQQGQTGAQHFSVSPGLLRWALKPRVLSGHPRQPSHRPHPAWSAEAEPAVRGRGKEKHSRVCTPGAFQILLPNTVLSLAQINTCKSKIKKQSVLQVLQI